MRDDEIADVARRLRVAVEIQAILRDEPVVEPGQALAALRPSPKRAAKAAKSPGAPRPKPAAPVISKPGIAAPVATPLTPIPTPACRHGAWRATRALHDSELTRRTAASAASRQTRTVRFGTGDRTPA
jgi:hypothetical protein